MGAESYRSVTKYQEDTEQALSDLQQQIFAAGEIATVRMLKLVISMRHASLQPRTVRNLC